ncbi:hypothetical protein Esi_0398_0014 [Ectocarpus siliculosus]|uniref:Uncharacterized protein n=1 Tax=Ectocarpus siliculosus TaxID=2880 RepID=D7G085_ECTSI|nr:hypothetical protein Esi_0398_0014 [Ectocarpus siliculosus]|eukprot:CBJ32967.1 hypothetical protein Esi_0398_0014 [Ectocarpus siliculosus]
MMAAPEETLPLRVSVNGDGPGNHDGHHGKKLALGATVAYLLVFALICFPAVVPLWHPTYYAELGAEQRGWTWLGANALWLALALLWTLLHLDNGPCVATACLLCSVLWFYLSLVLLSQACRGQLPLMAIADALVHLTMLIVCFRAAWVGVAKKSQKARSDGSSTWRRVLRKWALVSASATLFAAFLGCCSSSLPLIPPVSERESAPWEWNSAILFAMTLAVLWAAFLTRGGLVDETKRAACAWIALSFSGSFVLCSFSWQALGLDARSVTTSVVLAVETAVLAAAAVV